MAICDVPQSGAFVLRNCSVPTAFLAEDMTEQEGDLVTCDIHVASGKFVAVTRSEAHRLATESPCIDVARAMIWPCFADIHCHLDKGQIHDRAPSGDGTFLSALDAVASDRANWNGAETRLRMDFGLRCAFAHGSAAVRTHIDSDHAAAAVSWEAVDELRDRWAGRIDLQAVSLVQVGDLADPVLSRNVADRVAQFGGILGASTRQVPGLDAIVDTLFQLAQERDLALDFHVDESCDPNAKALSLIARTAIRRRFAGRVVVGHCCSLAAQDDDEVDQTLDLVAQAGLAVVTLPVLNLQLQDRQYGRTPRRRGMTLVHEMRARGIPVAIGGDNVRDPLHPYGDHDMLEVYRDATRIGHLDAPVGTWPHSITTTPRAIMNLPERLIGTAYPADFILFSARTYSELLARPQSDRVVVRNGRPSMAHLPDFRELDEIMPRGNGGKTRHAAP
ncbi:MAG: cytosine deaminase [Gammaproteobacteria bacterium]|nr:cytosine deaminase [Gammaproteobacteria bacterium]